jgi:hypothetical protein
MSMKAAASLTGSLLARKGAAYPAAYSAPTPSPDGASEGGATQRAYNDPRVIASAPPSPAAPSAAAPAAPQQAEQLQDGRFAPAQQGTPDEAAEPAKQAESAPQKSPIFDRTAEPEISDAQESVDAVGLPQVMDKMGRVRLSVRLDPDRYLRVKMASARTRWSAQDIVIAALDRYLAGKAESGTDEGGGQGNLN